MLFAVAIAFSMVAAARNVSLSVHDRPAAEVFRSLMAQTGKNFVYSSDILEGMKVTLDVKDQPLGKVLKRMFAGTGIEYSIKGKNVVLKRAEKKRAPKPKSVKKEPSAPLPESFLKAEPVELEEVIVVSRLEAPQVESLQKTSNFIDDGILRADFTWNPRDNSTVRFGGGYTLHSFRPQKTLRQYEVDDMKVINRDSVSPYIASEFNAYIEDDWRLSSRFRANAGLHLSMFHIEGRDKFGVSPRLSVSYRPHDNWAVKGAYGRTVQYVHQLTQSNLALPTDQWIPIVGDFKPETADKISIGGYWESPDGMWGASVEGYWKWMHNIVDYRDEYYLTPPLEFWNSRLTSGKGTAKGIDFKFEKKMGKLTGHIAYSLAWSDRTFPEKNGGKTYPARFDNRHTINILLNWKMSRKVELNIGWTGHSGNRFTFMPQKWQSPAFSLCNTWFLDNSLRVPLNNFQLPFYHRLDLGLTVRNRRGYWSFGLYNAYCNRNTIAIIRSYVNEQTDFHPTLWESGTWESGWRSRPVFMKLSFLPIIPSIAYTWQF